MWKMQGLKVSFHCIYLFNFSVVLNTAGDAEMHLHVSEANEPNEEVVGDVAFVIPKSSFVAA